jgi:hypothetical protein
MFLTGFIVSYSEKTKENRHVFDFESFPMSEIGGIGIRFHDRMLPRTKFQLLKWLETPSQI